MKTPDADYDDAMLTNPPEKKKGMLQRFNPFKKKQPAPLEIVDDAQIDRLRIEYERALAVREADDRKRLAIQQYQQRQQMQQVHQKPAQHIRRTAPTPAPVIQDPDVGAPEPAPQPSALTDTAPPSSVAPAEPSAPDISKSTYAEDLYRRAYMDNPRQPTAPMPVIPKRALREAQDIAESGETQYIATKSARRIGIAINAAILGVAFVIGIVGVQVIYTHMPTYPMVSIGIVAVSASAGVITSMAR